MVAGESKEVSDDFIASNLDVKETYLSERFVKSFLGDIKRKLSKDARRGVRIASFSMGKCDRALFVI